MRLRFIIAGGRDFNDDALLERECDAFIDELAPDKPYNKNVMCVLGDATGADAGGNRFAIRRGYDRTMFFANWKTYGKAAGPIRNKKMAYYAKGHSYIPIMCALIAFWDGKSEGTADMIDVAKKLKIETKIVLYNQNENHER